MTPYLGGVIYHEARQGDNIPAIEYLDKASQWKAMNWLVGQARTYRSWLCPQQLLEKLERPDEIQMNFESSVISAIYGSTKLQRVSDGFKSNPKRNYSLDKYVADAFSQIFQPTLQGRSLSESDLKLESAAIDFYTKNSGLQPQQAKKSILGLDSKDAITVNVTSDRLPCEAAEAETGFVRINYGLPALDSNIYKPMMTGQLKRVLQLFRAKRNTGDTKTRNFYDYQILTINKLLNK